MARPAHQSIVWRFDEFTGKPVGTAVLLVHRPEEGHRPELVHPAWSIRHQMLST
jgi:hypothetical protein